MLRFWTPFFEYKNDKISALWMIPLIPILLLIAYIASCIVLYSIQELTGLLEFSPLNGFTDHEWWLQNMLISTSTQAIYRLQHKKLV